MEFYKACKSGKYNIFPKVQRIGKGYVVMEKLKMYTEKCDTYQYMIHCFAMKMYSKRRKNKLKLIEENLEIEK